MFNTIDFQMVLVADESKVSAKGHDEILDVLNDALFYNSFVDIAPSTFTVTGLNPGAGEAVIAGTTIRISFGT